MVSQRPNASTPGEGFLGTLEGLLLGALLFAPGNEPFVAVVPTPGAPPRPSISARDQSVAVTSLFARAGNVLLIRSRSDRPAHDRARELRSCRDCGPRAGGRQSCTPDNKRGAVG